MSTTKKKNNKIINKKILITGIIASLLVIIIVLLSINLVISVKKYNNLSIEKENLKTEKDNLKAEKENLKLELGNEKTAKQELEENNKKIKQDADYNSYMWELNNAVASQINDLLIQADGNFVEMYNYVISNVDGSVYFNYKMDTFKTKQESTRKEYEKLINKIKSLSD